MATEEKAEKKDFTVVAQVFVHTTGEDEVEALKGVRDQLPKDAGIQNIQILPGHAHFG